MPPERLSDAPNRRADTQKQRANDPNRLDATTDEPDRLNGATTDEPDRLNEATADERATSPTIGAVLLVGITVILATATGTHLFGLAGGSQSAFATAAVEFSPADDRVSVTWLANADAEKLKVRLLVDGERRAVLLDEVGDRVVVDRDGVTISSGSVGHWDTPAIDDGDRVTVTVLAIKNGERVVVAEKSGRV